TTRSVPGARPDACNGSPRASQQSRRPAPWVRIARGTRGGLREGVILREVGGRDRALEPRVDGRVAPDDARAPLLRSPARSSGFTGKSVRTAALRPKIGKRGTCRASSSLRAK